MIDVDALERNLKSAALRGVMLGLMAQIVTNESGHKTTVKYADLSQYENGRRRGHIEKRSNEWLILFDPRCQETQLLDFFLHELSHAKNDWYSMVDLDNPSEVARADSYAARRGGNGSFARGGKVESRSERDAAKWGAYVRQYVSDDKGIISQLGWILRNGLP